MTARAYLFVSKATIRWCMARYLSWDDPSNEAAWGDLYPFRNNEGVPDTTKYTSFLSFRRTAREYLSQDPDPFVPTNWTAVDVSNWWRFDVTNPAPGQPSADDQRERTMSPQSLEFMRSLTPQSQTIQWAHVMDPELAKAWLKRAMKHSPAEIESMPGAQQFEVVRDMWASFGQFWKAMNLAPQGWAPYRNAWEYYARPSNAQIVLRNMQGTWYPRPFSAPIWRKAPSTWYPEDAPKYLGPWRWEAILANEQWGAARTGHTRLDANLTVRFGSLAHYWNRATDYGNAVFGAPAPFYFDNTDSRHYACQDAVMYGSVILSADPAKSAGTAFAPNMEVHMFWIDNAGFLSGGMDPVYFAMDAGGNPPIGANTQPVRIPHHHFDMNDALVGYSTPQQGVAPGTATRRPRYVWGITRCASDLPDVEMSRAPAFYTRFDVSGAAAGDWGRTLDAASDHIAVKRPTGQPRVATWDQTWRDGILTSINPLLGDLGANYVQFPCTGANWIDLTAAQTGSKIPGRWLQSCPHNLIGYSGFEHAFAQTDDSMIFPLVLWQPPAKRYVDLLWPLLMRLDAMPAEQIAYEVKLDVLGKNAFSLKAMGNDLNPQERTDALAQAERGFASQMMEQRRQTGIETQQAMAESGKVARLIYGIASGVTTAVVSAVATPAVGAAVGAGFALLNGAIGMADAAAQAQAQRDVWNPGGTDVFGRLDGLEMSSGDYATMILGNFERYSIYHIASASDDTVTEVQGQIYDAMRCAARVPGNMTGAVPAAAPLGVAFTRWWPDFVVDVGADPLHPAAPYPVGYAPTTISLVGLLGGNMILPRQVFFPEPPQRRRLHNLAPAEETTVDPKVVAASAVAGIAVGLLISETTRD